MTYKDYLDDGGLPLFNTRDVGRSDGVHKHQCTCGGWDFPQFMTDVRAFDIGDDFACGGCMSTWERNLIPIMNGDDFLIRHEWRAKFTELINGAKDDGAEWVKMHYLTREKNKAIMREKVYDSAPDNHPDKMRLKARRVALEARIVRERI